MNSPSLTPIEELINIVSKYCIERNIPYVIVGGISVLFWGYPRTTQDVDVIIDHRKLDVDDFVEYLKCNEISCSKADLQYAFENNQHSNINFYKETLFRLDIKGVYTKREQVAIEERHKQKWKDMIIHIDNPHNLIVSKLSYGSQQDHEDALAVLVRNINSLDMQKLKQKAKMNKVEKELKQLLKKAEIDL